MQQQPFRLQTLGRLALVGPDGVEDASLSTRRRKLALLCVLALSNRPMARDTLTEMFWGDQDEKRARHSLSDALSHLRRALGPGSIATRSTEVELSKSASLTCDAHSLMVDAAAHRWADVLAHYRGPFLDAVHVGGSARFEQWVDSQRAALESHFITACRMECERLAGTEDHAARASIAARWLQCDPLSSAAAVHRLDALASPGTREAARLAVDAYESLCRLLALEYEASPHESVRRLAHEIRERERRPDEDARANQRRAMDPVLRESASTQATAPISGLTATPIEVASDRFAAVAVPRRRHVVRPILLGFGFLGVVALFWLNTQLSRTRAAGATGDLMASSSTIAVSNATTLSPVAAARYNAAMDLASRQDTHERRLALLEQAVALDSTFALAGYRLALRLNVDEHTRARVHAELARAQRHAHRLPERERLRVEGVYHMLVTGEFSLAARAFRERLTLMPDDLSTWHDLGMVYQYLGDERRAADAYERALRSNPRSMASWSNLLDARYASGDVSGTQRALDELAEQLPGHPGLFRQTASVAAAEGDLSLAEQQLRAMLAATPGSPRAQSVGHVLLAGVLWTAGRLDDGDAAQRTAIAIDRARGDELSALRNAVTLARAIVWLRRDNAAARDELEAALKRAPLDSIAPLERPYLELSTLWALLGESETARVLLREYERINPASSRRQDAGAHHLALGMIALQERRPKDAVRALARAQSPLCAVCGLPELGLAYEQLGMIDSARFAYERYLSTPTLRRVEHTDPLHRRWVSTRLTAQGARLVVPRRETP